MARKRRIFHAVWSGYLLTLASSLVSLATIPIALRVLGKDTFGLWSAVLQVTSFGSIFDLGMGPTLARFAADYKDDPNNPEYARFIKSVFFVGLVQGLAFSVVTVCLVPWLPGLMKLPAGQEGHFVRLLLWQAAPLAVAFPTRPLAQLLYSQQRIAALNFASLAGVLVYGATLVLGLQVGWGVYSYVVATWCQCFIYQGAVLACVLRAQLLPNLSGAKVSLKLLKPMTAFSGNVFLVFLGLRLVNFAPTLIITRQLGLGALADWKVGTSLVFLAWQLVGGIPNAAEPALWELFSRQELPKVRQRLLDTLIVTASLAAMCGAGIATINPVFIRVWTSGRVLWSSTADLFLGLWIVIVAAATCLNMVPGITKRLQAMKCFYVSEGAALVALAYLPAGYIRDHWLVGLAMLLAVAAFRLAYGLTRAHRDLHIPWRVLAWTAGRALGVAASLLAVGTGLRLITAPLPGLTQLCLCLAVFGLVALPVAYFVGCPAEYQALLRAQLRRFWRRRSPEAPRA